MNGRNKVSVCRELQQKQGRLTALKSSLTRVNRHQKVKRTIHIHLSASLSLLLSFHFPLIILLHLQQVAVLCSGNVCQRSCSTSSPVSSLLGWVTAFG